jgi:hypothetical protein
LNLLETVIGTFMNYCNPYSLLIVLGLCCVFQQVPASAQTTPQTRTARASTGSISGQVTIHGKGKAGIVIGLRSGEFGAQQGSALKGTTDAQGNYRISDVPAGNYMVAPMAPGFVMSDQNSFGERGKALLLAEGESVENIDFSLVRGGVITGKVTTADNRPVIEERVYLAPVDFTVNQRGSGFQSSGAATDDRGIYRMFGLAPGRYKIAVGQSEDRSFMNGPPGRPYYKQTFHPDVSDISKATIVEVTEGGEAANVDISLGRLTQTYAVSGRIIDGETEQPVGNVRLGVQLVLNSQRRSFVNSYTTSNKQGEFKLENLAPGKYGIFINPQAEGSARVIDNPFEIIDRDVEGVVIKTAKSATLSGSIVLENSEDKVLFARLLKLRIDAYVETEGPSFGHRGAINPDGSFRITGLETGKARLSLGAQERELLKGFSISRVERDGTPQTEDIVIRDGEDIHGVRIVVVFGSASIRGVIKVENGTLAADARIFIRATKVGENNSSMRPPQVDARGHFLIDGLSGGTYDLVVNVFTPGRQRGSPPTASIQVIAPEGEVTEVTLTVNLEQKAPSQSP